MKIEEYCPIVAWLDSKVELGATQALIELGIEKEHGPRHRFACLLEFDKRQRKYKPPIVYPAVKGR